MSKAVVHESKNPKVEQAIAQMFLIPQKKANDADPKKLDAIIKIVIKEKND